MKAAYQLFVAKRQPRTKLNGEQGKTAGGQRGLSDRPFSNRIADKPNQPVSQLGTIQLLSCFYLFHCGLEARARLFAHLPWLHSADLRFAISLLVGSVNGTIWLMNSSDDEAKMQSWKGA